MSNKKTRPELMVINRGDLEGRSSLTIKINATNNQANANGGLAALRNVQGKSNIERYNATFRFGAQFVEEHEEEIGKILDRINSGLAAMRRTVRSTLTEAEQRSGNKIAIQRAVMNEMKNFLEGTTYSMDDIKLIMDELGFLRTERGKKMELDVSLGYIAKEEFSFSKARVIEGSKWYVKNADLPGGKFVPSESEAAFAEANNQLERLEIIYGETIDKLEMTTDEQVLKGIGLFASKLPEGDIDVYSMDIESREEVDRQVREIKSKLGRK